MYYCYLKKGRPLFHKIVCLCFTFLSLFSVLLCVNAQLLPPQLHDNQLSAKEKKEGWKLLFDGRTTTGWKGAFITRFPAKGWKVENGLLSVQSPGGADSANSGDIITLNDYTNFELSVNFKITGGANSGIKYFVDAGQPVPANPKSAIGLEFQILDDDRHPDAKPGMNGNRYKLMHLKDLRKGVAGDFSGGTPVENDVELGSGQIDIASVIKAVQKSGIEYYYIEDESSNVNLQVPVSIACLKGL